eukprot:CAMPEP_0171971116 /NCGR_PEP_ID=MMETSP0993-20121228/216264_1 /TAXON_ID=483369 /ORGANISM="non described non described, Strain CCMP2098" /LENGTH=71 /DNA_ID=CAMNT_0012621379 /DNA_START=36 /DNA_END=247 /DNA_ORIENTATION=-
MTTGDDSKHGCLGSRRRDGKVQERFDSLARQSATVVCIERAGPGADGGSYTMRGLDMTHLLAPLHQLMDKA